MATIRKSLLALIDDGKKDGRAGLISQLLAFEALGSKLSPSDAFPLVLDYLRSKVAATVVLHGAVRKLVPCRRGAIAGADDGSVALVGTKGELDLMGKHKKSVTCLCGHSELYASGCEDGTIKLWNVEKLSETASFTAHPSSVRCLVMTSDSEILISGGEDCTLRVWLLREGKESKVVTGHSAAVSAVVLSPGASHCISAGSDGEVKVWEANTWTESGTVSAHTQAITCLLLSSDARVLVSASLDGSVKLWNWATLQLLRTLEGHSQGVVSAALTPDGLRLVTGSMDHIVRVWRVDEEEEEPVELKGHLKEVECVGVTSSGNYVWSVASDATVHVWSLSDYHEVASLKSHSDAVLSLCICSDGRTVLTGGRDCMVKVWTYHDSPEVHTLGSHETGVTCLGLTPDGQVAVTGSQDGKVKIWDLQSLGEKAAVAGHSQSIVCLAMFHDGERFATADEYSIKIWSLIDYSELAVYDGHSPSQITRLAVSPDSLLLISTSNDKTARAWATDTKKELATMKGHTAPVISLAIASHGRCAATGSVDTSVKIWSCGDFSLLMSLIGHSAPVTEVVFSSKGDLVVSGAEDGVVKVWRQRSNEELFTLSAHSRPLRCLWLTSDRLISTSADKQVKVHSLLTGSEVAVLYGHKDSVTALTATSDERFAVTGASDCGVMVWSVEYMREVARYEAHGKRVTAVALSRDEKSVVTAGEDGGVRLISLALKIPALRDIPKPPLNNYLSSVGINSLTASAIDRLRNGKVVHKSVAFACILPYYFNALHVCAYFNHSQSIEVYLRMGVPILSGSFGSPLTVALKRNTIRCVNAILEHLITLCEENHSWSQVQEITEDLPKLLFCNTPQLTPFFGLLLRPTDQPRLPNFIVPASALPIVNLSEFWYIKSEDYRDEESGEQQEVVEFQVSDIRWNFEIGSSKSLEFLSALENCDDRKVLTTPIVRALIGSKWDKLMPMTLTITMLYASLLFCMVWVVFRYGDPSIVKGLFLALNCFFLLYELVQSLVHGADYWKDPWNYLDWVRSGMCMVWVLYLEGYRYVELLAVCMCFLRGFTYFRTFKMTRMFVRMTLEVVKEMYSFLVIFAYTTIAFGMMYAVLVPGEIKDAFGAWMTAYQLLMGTYTTEGFGALQWLCFTSASLVNVIIMLNLLISILGDAYEHAQMSSKENDSLEELRIIIEYESMLFWRRQLGSPSVFIKCWAMEDTSGKAEWEGRVNQITKLIKADVQLNQQREVEKSLAVEKRVKQLQDKLVSLEGKCSTIPALAANIEKRQNDTEARIDALIASTEAVLDSRLQQLESTVDRLISALS